MISIVIISKDESALDDTLTQVEQQAIATAGPVEIVVVDASSGRLADIQRRHPVVRWIDFERPPGVAISIPHQRNAGVHASEGEVVVFTDAGCLPKPQWLERLTAPIVSGEEEVCSGRVASNQDGPDLYERWHQVVERSKYLDEAPTINLAFRRSAFDAISGFDESFEYGSDIDFTWRLRDVGYRIRSVSGAVVTHHWGSPGRRLRRSYLYGQARARLYAKHRDRAITVWRDDPMVVAYPLFIIGLPLSLKFRWYPGLLVIPAWRNRRYGAGQVLADHLAFGAGVMSFAFRR